MSAHRAFEIYAHIVWSTWRRQECIARRVVDDVRLAVEDAATRTSSVVRALAILSDHVHIVLSLRPSSRLSDFIRLAKSGSSYRSGQRIPGSVKWSRGFYVRSLGARELDQVIAYVHHQYLRHPDRIPH